MKNRKSKVGRAIAAPAHFQRGLVGFAVALPTLRKMFPTRIIGFPWPYQFLGTKLKVNASKSS